MYTTSPSRQVCDKVVIYSWIFGMITYFDFSGIKTAGSLNNDAGDAIKSALKMIEESVRTY